MNRRRVGIKPCSSPALAFSSASRPTVNPTGRRRRYTMIYIIRVLVALGGDTPNAAAYGLAPCAFLRGEPS